MDIENLFNNVSRMDLLRAFGLAPRPRDYILPAVGLFSLGALLGAGITLLFAPKSGRKLRKEISEELNSRFEDLGESFDQFTARIRGEDSGEKQEGEQEEGEQEEGEQEEGEQEEREQAA